jgi:hypothetical protein
MMKISSDQQFTLTQKSVSTILDGNSIILNHDKGIYYELNEVGTLVWQMLSEGDTPMSPEQIKNNIVNAFEVNSGECMDDICSLLEQLIEADLVTPC